MALATPAEVLPVNVEFSIRREGESPHAWIAPPSAVAWLPVKVQPRTVRFPKLHTAPP